MELTASIKKSIDNSVLCWLATVSSKNIPNVSPKEIFNYFEKETIIIANIASPQSIRNIVHNQNVCVSFIDILVQKGFQLKGLAEIIKKNNTKFPEMEKVLLKMTGGIFPFTAIIAVTIEQAKEIIAPRYMLFPNTTDEEQIENAKKIYGL